MKREARGKPQIWVVSRLPISSQTALSENKYGRCSYKDMKYAGDGEDMYVPP